MNAISKSQNVAPSTKPASTQENIKKTVVAEQPKAEQVKAEKPKEAKTKVEAPAAPKQTPVEERLYVLATTEGEAMKFRGKQRQIIYDVLREAKEPQTIAQVAKLAGKAGLTAVGGVEPSVRYHLHHLTNDGVTKVTNPLLPTE